MESTLKALGDILLNAVPTFLLFLLLHFYLKAVFFKPIAKVLKDRDEATAGARRRAEEALVKAEEKARQYEEAMRGARSELYKEQEEQRRKWKAEQDAAIAAAQADSKAMVASAREQIAEEAAIARKTLEAESRTLASQIADNLLEGRAA